MMRKTIYLFIAILFALNFSSCSTSEQVTDREPGRETVESSDTDTADSGDLDLARYRNSLRDLFETQYHDQPTVFQQQYEEQEEVDTDPFDGYRIQILSTRKVSLADATAKKFRLWADSTFTDYIPRAYVFFRQPYYKVHVGDFQDRNRTIRFTRIVKRQFPDAWVVHDRINPTLVPADSLELGIRN